MIRRFTGAYLAAFIITELSMAPAHAQFGLVSEKQELEAGRTADAEITSKYRISHDSYYNALVSHLGTRITRVCKRPNIPWTFRVIDSKELNAFSVPGYVYVNTGLIEATGRDQDQLAGVIEHEVGHTCGKHAVKNMEKGTIGNVLVSLIGGRNKAVSGLANVAANLIMLGYSRDEENDADKRAVHYTVRAGYDPSGLVRFFEMLQQKEGNGTNIVYFRTHPPTSDRIARVQQNIARETGSGYSPDRVRYR